MVFATLTLAACSSAPVVTIVRTSATYTIPQAEQSARSVSLGSVAGSSADSAPAARQKALASLRRQGSEGQKIADLLTKGFPATTRAVPVHVEAATVDGRPAYIVVEASGPAGGTLETRRVWVFDGEKGTVLGSAAFR